MRMLFVHLVVKVDWKVSEDYLVFSVAQTSSNFLLELLNALWIFGGKGKCKRHYKKL